MKQVKGVFFPLPYLYVNRFFNDGKTVFIKRATAFKSLKPGMTLIFYQSQKNTGLVGEGKIKNIIISEDPFSFFELFGDSVFLTKDELNNYINSQKKWGSFGEKRFANRKPWVAFELEDITKYKEKITPQRYIPVCGKYLYDE